MGMVAPVAPIGHSGAVKAYCSRVGFAACPGQRVAGSHNPSAAQATTALSLCGSESALATLVQVRLSVPMTFDALTVCSWYGTFCAIAGVDSFDERAALAGLPSIDSISLLPVLLGQTNDNNRINAASNTRRRSLALGSEPTDGFKNGSTVAGWIVEEEDGSMYKLILGKWDQSTWVGPHFPNASTDFEPSYFVENCTIGTKIGCLL